MKVEYARPFTERCYWVRLVFLVLFASTGFALSQVLLYKVPVSWGVGGGMLRPRAMNALGANC